EKDTGLRHPNPQQPTPQAPNGILEERRRRHPRNERVAELQVGLCASLFSISLALNRDDHSAASGTANRVPRTFLGKLILLLTVRANDVNEHQRPPPVRSRVAGAPGVLRGLTAGLARRARELHGQRSQETSVASRSAHAVGFQI